MWPTSIGNRTLVGAEAALVSAALTRVAEHIREESSGLVDQWHYGIQLFDEMPWSQRLALLDRVASYLLTASALPEPTAVDEAAVGVVFALIHDQVTCELEGMGNGDGHWCGLVAAAYEQAIEYPGDVADPLQATFDHRDPDAWVRVVETLADRILWDRDYEIAAGLLDRSPEQTEYIKRYLGIDDEYFSSPAPDVVAPAAIEATYHRLGVRSSH